MLFMTIDFSQAMMKESRLRNSFLQNKGITRLTFNKIFANLNEKDIADSKLFFGSQ